MGGFIMGFLARTPGQAAVKQQLDAKFMVAAVRVNIPRNLFFAGASLVAAATAPPPNGLGINLTGGTLGRLQPHWLDFLRNTIAPVEDRAMPESW
jgi:hypothetical protein